ncbi:MAG: chorismate mutase [Clostridia bacterium]|nr:chorismate mutase [Clostridia bacterium]
MTELDEARRIISESDAEIARCFERRMSAVRDIAAYKKERGLPIEDRERERTLLESTVSLIDDDEVRPYFAGVFRSLTDSSKSYQRRLIKGMRIAYSGVPGAFAHLAAKKAFPDADYAAYPDFAAAYDAVVTGECDAAMLPLENSYEGDVGQVMDLAFFGTLKINAIYSAEVTQNLLALPGASIEDIREVISHPQALGQCEKYVKRHGWITTKATNTALAAKTVLESGRYDLAAIASEEAASEYGLVRLEGHIEESRSNTTRFAVFSRAATAPSDSDSRFVMTFTVNNEAGSLGRAVSVIGYNGFDLRALKSRPTKNLSWEYYFFAEGEGNINDADGKQMQKELTLCCNNVCVLGSFEGEIQI